MDQQNPKNFLPVVMAVIVTAVLVGGVMYFWQTSKTPEGATKITSTDTEETCLVDNNSPIVEFNCKQSGGAYSNSRCSCSAVEGEYEESTGYCITALGTPGGELGETAKKLQELQMLKSK